MGNIIWNAQARLYQALVRPGPTCILQPKLAEREGVRSKRVLIGETITETVEGPHIVTVNRD